MRELQILLLIVFLALLSACADSSISESEAVAIAYGWAGQRDVFEHMEGWMTILRETDVFSNESYFVVIFKNDIPLGYDAADYGLNIVVEQNSGDVVYIGGYRAHIFDENFSREIDFGPYYEGIYVPR